MNQVAKIIFLIFIITQVYCQVTPSLCPNLKDQTTCNQNQACSWTQTNEQACSSPVQCKNFNKSDCFQNKSSCSWTQATTAQCLVNAGYCKVDNDQCNDATNCVLNQPTCTVKGQGFGCKKITDSTNCGKQNECTWTPGFCSTNDYCQTIYQQDQCTGNDGCVWQMIQQGIYSCQAQSNKCGGFSTNETCSALKSCKWNATEQCQDKSNYCDHQNCDKEFCVSTPLNCTPNTTQNDCSALDQTNCQQQDQKCSYKNAQDSSCANVNQCSIFGLQNQCNSQNTCSWSNVYTCQAKGSTSSYSTNLVAGIVVLFIMFLSF